MKSNERVVRDSQSIASEWEDYFKGLYAPLEKSLWRR